MKFKEKAQLFAESYLSAVKKYAFFLESSSDEDEGDEGDEKNKSEEKKSSGRPSMKDDEQKKREKNFAQRPEDKDKARRDAKKASGGETIPGKKRKEEPGDFKRKSPQEENDAADLSKRYRGVEKPEFKSLGSKESENDVDVDVDSIEQQLVDIKKQIRAERDGQKQYALRRELRRLEDKQIQAQQKRAGLRPENTEEELEKKKPEHERNIKVTPRFERGAWQDKTDKVRKDGDLDVPVHQRVVSAHPETKAKELDWKKDHLTKDEYKSNESPERDLAPPPTFQRPARSGELKTVSVEDQEKKELYAWIKAHMSRDEVKKNPQAALAKAKEGVRKNKEERSRIRGEIDSDDAPEALAKRAVELGGAPEEEGAGRSWSANPETVKAKVMRQFANNKQRPLNMSMPSDAQSQISGFFSQIRNEYEKAKETLVRAGHNPMEFQTPNMQRLFHIVEEVFKLPPLNPEDPASVAMFKTRANEARSDITKIVPPQFLQSTLQSYPFGDDQNPQIAAKIEARIQDETSKSTRLLDGEEEKIATKKIVDILPKLRIQEFIKLFDYYQQNPKEIDRSERALRQVNAGVTGSLRGEHSGRRTAEDFHNADSEFIPGADVEEEDIENEPEEISDSDEEGAHDGVASGEKDWFEELHGLVSREDGQGLDASGQSKGRLQNILKAQHAFDNIFNDMNDLENSSKLKGNLPGKERTSKASKFLEALFGEVEGPGEGDFELQKIAVDGLARHYAIFQIGKMAEHESEKIANVNDPIERSKLGERLKKTAMNTFGQLAKDKVTKRKIKYTLVNMMTKGPSGLTLSDPKRLKLSGDEADMAKVIYRTFNPSDLGGMRAAEYGFDDFILDKASDVEDKIIAIIDAKVRGEREIKQDMDSQFAAGKERSRQAPSEVEQGVAQHKDRLGQRDSLLSQEREEELAHKKALKTAEDPSKIPPRTSRLDTIRGKHFRPGSGDRPPIMGVKPEFATPPKMLGNVTPDREDKPKGKRPPKYAPHNPNIVRPPGVKKPVTKESFMNKVSSFFISEGFAMNSRNIKSYLVALCKTGSINKDFLEEMLIDLSDVEQSEGKGWETIDKKKTKKLRG